MHFQVTPMEIEYTTSWPNGSTVSVWLPVSLHTKSAPFINTNCKPNPKNPTAPVCTNYTKKEGWQTVETHAYKPPKGAAAINFAKVLYLALGPVGMPFETVYHRVGVAVWLG